MSVSFTGIGALFYFILTIIGLSRRLYKMNGPDRQKIRFFGGGILSVVFFIIAWSILNSYNIINLEDLIGMIATIKSDLYDVIESNISYIVSLRDIL